MINRPYGGSYTIKQTPNTPLEFKLEVEYETIDSGYIFPTSSGLYHYQKVGELPIIDYSVGNITPFYPPSYPEVNDDGGLSSDFFDLSSTNKTINSNVYNPSGLSGGPLLLKSGSATLTFDPSGLEYNITYESASYEYRPLSGSTLNSNNVNITGSNFTGSASEDPYNIYNRGDKDGVFIFEYSKSYSDAENGTNNTFEDWGTSGDYYLDIPLNIEKLENISPHDSNFPPKVTLFVASGSYEDNIIPSDSDYITYDEWEGNTPGANELDIDVNYTFRFSKSNLEPLLSSNVGDLFIKPMIKTSREVKYRLINYQAIFKYNNVITLEYDINRNSPTTCDIESNQELSFFTLIGNSGDIVEIEGLFSGTCNDDRTDGATTRGEFTLTAEHSETVLDNIFVQEDATQNSSFLNFSITGIISFTMPANEITLSTRYVFENPGTNRQVNANVKVKTINGNAPTSNIVEQACTGFGDF